MTSAASSFADDGDELYRAANAAFGIEPHEPVIPESDEVIQETIRQGEEAKAKLRAAGYVSRARRPR